MGKITVFFKQGCKHCQRAKALLTSKNIPFEGIDITHNERQRLLMIYLSDRQTVPQIFFNEQPIGGASELLALAEQKAFDQRLQTVLAAPTPTHFPPQDISDRVLANTELPLSQVLNKATVDITKEPGFEPVIPVFQKQFGFMPHAFKYMAIWPEAFTTWSCAHLTLWRNAASILGDFLTVVGFATSNAADCSYCAAHATQLSIDDGVKPEKIAQLYDFYRNPNITDDSVLPFTPFERSLIRIARAATLNRVTGKDTAVVHRLASARAGQAISGVAAVTACYGFLNRFNDTIGTEIEGKINQTAMNELGDDWLMGKHETQDSADAEQSSNAPFSDSRDEIEPQRLQSFLDTNVSLMGEDMNAYLRKHLGFAPGWIQQIPFGDARQAIARFYVAMTETSQVSSDLKHLMNLVVTQENNHRYLADQERFMAHRAALLKGIESEKSLQRIAICLDVSKGQEGGNAYFDAREQAALKLAAAASYFPPFTPYALIKDLQHYFTPQQVVELVMSVGVCGMAQRWTAVMPTAQTEAEITEFLLTQIRQTARP